MRPRQVVPDLASHADTGLDVMRECCVQKSLGSQEHDTLDGTSVVVREPPNSDYRKKALRSVDEACGIRERSSACAS